MAVGTGWVGGGCRHGGWVEALCVCGFCGWGVGCSHRSVGWGWALPQQVQYALHLCWWARPGTLRCQPGEDHLAGVVGEDHPCSA